MNELILLTDASINNQTKIGYGAYLILPAATSLPQTETLIEHIKVKRFEQTSSTKLELQTLLWALSEMPKSLCHVCIYTDCQNIITLPSRRQRIEKNNYLSTNNKPLINSELYQTFYLATDLLSHELIKIKGHQKTHEKNDLDRVFALVDKAARKALREELK